jgi:hypothetical protein
MCTNAKRQLHQICEQLQQAVFLVTEHLLNIDLSLALRLDGMVCYTISF